MIRVVALSLPLMLVAACASAPTQSGFLSSYDGLEARDDRVRSKVQERRARDRLAAVTKVAIAPTRLQGPGGDWMSEAERTALLREVDAQLCFELSERYEIAPEADAQAARVRAAVTRVKPTGRAGSAVSAAASFFIPGPIGVRTPGTEGGLSAEAEMLAPGGGEQISAITWTRRATTLGTDNPSLSRIGDALQFVEPFADDAAKAMSGDDPPKRKIDSANDPCAEFGPRFRPEGWAAKFVTGLYVPSLSGAKDDKPAEPPAEPKP